MTREIDNYYMKQSEPEKSCLMALREIILRFDPAITEAWKYGMPFFCVKGKMFCYLWLQKKTRVPYIGIVEGGRISHPELIQEKRARMKIMLVDPQADIPLKTIHHILKKARTFY
jgi:hypothetical protein